jgi:dynactin complex subunit
MKHYLEIQQIMAEKRTLMDMLICDNSRTNERINELRQELKELEFQLRQALIE